MLVNHPASLTGTYYALKFIFHEANRSLPVVGLVFENQLFMVFGFSSRVVYQLLVNKLSQLHPVSWLDFGRRSVMRYSANDRFLKELLEEWCEGVLCTNPGSTGLLGVGDYFRGTDKSNSQSGLIEKVAILLQKDMSENQVVDLRGLSKIEARIVVLSVLRMIKESYAHGDMMNDGMIIMTGLGKEIPGEVNHEQEVQQAISNLLQGELGLDIVVGQGGIPVKTDADMGLLRTHRKSFTVLQRDELPGSRACVRKPQDLGVLRVTRTSLHKWLLKSKQ